jgi:hypothetical protein
MLSRTNNSTSTIRGDEFMIVRSESLQFQDPPGALNVACQIRRRNFRESAQGFCIR